MFKLTRNLAIVFAGIGLLAIILLAGSLSSLHLAEAEPFPFSLAAKTLSQAGAGGSLAGGDIFLFLMRVLLTLLWLIIPIILIGSIFSRRLRQELLRMLSWLVPIILILLLLGQNIKPNAKPLDENQLLSNPGNVPEAAVPTLEPPTFTPNVPDWMVIAGSIIIVSGITALAVWAGLAIWRRRRAQLTSVQQLADEAQVALDSIQAGGDLKNTVIRCYSEMSRVVKEQRGVTRSESMTPIEFESRLTALGLPGDAVHQLTLVFQDVRYGNHQPGEREERQAIMSLTTIIDVCRSANEAA
jgi:hypothetical protein